MKNILLHRILCAVMMTALLIGALSGCGSKNESGNSFPAMADAIILPLHDYQNLPKADRLKAIDYQEEGGYLRELCKLLGLDFDTVYPPMQGLAHGRDEEQSRSDAAKAGPTAPQVEEDQKLAKALLGEHFSKSGWQLSLMEDGTYTMTATQDVKFSVGGWKVRDGVLLLGDEPTRMTEKGIYVDEISEPFIHGEFVGLWHAMNTGAGGFGARYALYGNGTFVHASSETGVFERELYKAGRWSVADGELRLEVEARWVVPVGNIEDIIPNDELIILGEKGLVKVMYNPPEIEAYSIAQIGADPATGRGVIAIDGVTFYDFNERTDLFDGFYNLPGSDRRP